MLCSLDMRKKNIIDMEFMWMNKGDIFEGEFGATAKLLPYELEVPSLSHGNSFLQSRIKLHTIDSSP